APRVLWLCSPRTALDPLGHLGGQRRQLRCTQPKLLPARPPARDTWPSRAECLLRARCDVTPQTSGTPLRICPDPATRALVDTTTQPAPRCCPGPARARRRTGMQPAPRQQVRTRISIDVSFSRVQYPVEG